MIRTLKTLFVSVLMLLLGFSAVSQTRVRKPAVNKPAAKKTVPADPKTSPTPSPTTVPGKRNERPGGTNPIAPAPDPILKKAVTELPYFYEFTQPKFTITRLTIKHDEAGKGTLTFYKGEFDEPITEPVQLSQATLDKIAAVLASLDFLNSTENYQYDKDYSHLGNVAFRLKKDGREREVHFNYTTNKDAKELADIYRRVGNQVTWLFDMTVARDNQPLDAPRMVDALQSYLGRDEIADPKQLIPFLQALSNDERIPLIARNHAAKIIKQIEKEKK